VLFPSYATLSYIVEAQLSLLPQPTPHTRHISQIWQPCAMINVSLAAEITSQKLSNNGKHSNQCVTYIEIELTSVCQETRHVFLTRGAALKLTRHLSAFSIIVSWFMKIFKLITTYLHGAQSFLRSLQVLRWSRNSPRFTEPEGSLPHSQMPATCPYFELDRSNPCPHIKLS
jgi:hypothetical protein